MKRHLGKQSDILKRWKKLQEFCDIKGGTIVGLWSLMMLALIPYSVLAKWEFPTSIVTAYLGVISAYAVNRTFKKEDKGENS